MKNIYDISPTLSPAVRVWPGDTPLSREVLLDMENGSNLTLSTLRTSVHIGAHADAPSHYGQGAPSIEKRPLDLYLGLCQVIHISATPGGRIGVEDLQGPITAERLLVATGTYPNPEIFREDFCAFSPSLVDHLHKVGVRLLGIDTPSVDPFSSKDLPAHQACLRNNMAILEGLLLEGVPEGHYELIALPLKLRDFDASPVRAILREL